MNTSLYEQNLLIKFTKQGLINQNPKLSIVQKLPQNHEIMHENEKNNAKGRVK